MITCVYMFFSEMEKLYNKFNISKVMIHIKSYNGIINSSAAALIFEICNEEKLGSNHIMLKR